MKKRQGAWSLVCRCAADPWIKGRDRRPRRSLTTHEGEMPFAWSLASRPVGDKWARPAVTPYHSKIGSDLRI